MHTPSSDTNGSHRLSTTDQTEDDGYHCQYEQNVDQVADHGTKADEAYEPADDEHYDDDVYQVVHGFWVFYWHGAPFVPFR